MIASFYRSIITPNSEASQSALKNNSKIFKQIVVETARLPLSAQASPSLDLDLIIKEHDGVDKLLESFRNQTASFLPRTEILNEALQFYVHAGQLDKAHDLFMAMPGQCTLS